jgi:hypothetical protein
MQSTVWIQSNLYICRFWEKLYFHFSIRSYFKTLQWQTFWITNQQNKHTFVEDSAVCYQILLVYWFQIWIILIFFFHCPMLNLHGGGGHLAYLIDTRTKNCTESSKNYLCTVWVQSYKLVFTSCCWNNDSASNFLYILLGH